MRGGRPLPLTAVRFFIQLYGILYSFTEKWIYWDRIVLPEEGFLCVEL